MQCRGVASTDAVSLLYHTAAVPLRCRISLNSQAMHKHSQINTQAAAGPLTGQAERTGQQTGEEDTRPETKGQRVMHAIIL